MKTILTNEQKFIRDMEKILKIKLAKYNMKGAVLLIPDKNGQYSIPTRKVFQVNNQLGQIPVA